MPTPSASILGTTTLTLAPTLLTALRIAPLLTTTASVTHAYMEFVTTTSFLGPPPMQSRLSAAILKSTAHTKPSSASAADLAIAKEKVAPAWFVVFFNTGLWSVVGLNTLTLASASANLFLFSTGLGNQKRFYTVGLAAAVAHYAFVPLVAPSVERLFGLCAAQEKGEGRKGGLSAVANFEEWVGVHRVRIMTVDLLAWVSFAVGCIGAVTV